MNRICAVSLCLVLLLGIGCKTTDETAATRAEVVTVSGLAEVQRAESWQSLRSGRPLNVGDQVRTGADGRVEVRFSPFGGVMTIQPDSLLQLEQVGPTATNQQVIAVVQLSRGRVVGDTLKLPKDAKVVVKTRGGSFAIP